MPKRALIERRPWLLASIAAAIAYYVLKDRAFPGLYLLAIEAAALLLLAAYAVLRHGSADARLLAGMMVLGGIGVVAVELDSYAGALILIGGLALGIGVLLKHRRATIAPAHKAAATALLLLTPLICWRLPANRAEAVTLAIFGLALGGMAGAAWTSSFPRHRVGLGALLYVAASIIGIAGQGPLAESVLPSLVSWPAFYFGHFLICTGVVQTLRARP